MQCYPMVGYILLHGTCQTFPNKEAAFETVRNILFNGGTANFPLGLVPKKRPPQVPKSFIKCRETLLLGDLWRPFLVNQPKWKFTRGNVRCFFFKVGQGGVRIIMILAGKSGAKREKVKKQAGRS